MILRDPIEKFLTSMSAPELDKRIVGHKGYGLIQLIHGHGKGKTTAALGQAIRALGAGKKVAIIYFDKGGETHYNERHILDELDGMTYWPTGRDRIDPETGRFDFSITDLDRSEARRGLNLAASALAGAFDLVILDEINSTLNLGMLELSDVLTTIDGKSKTTELILTGRNPHEELLARAHLITESKLDRHYFYSGVPAREGLDF